MLWLRVDDVAGLYVDDAWYVLIAEAIATGKGFTLINAPVPGILSFYPPGFPLLLAAVFRIAPGFPRDLPWLKLPSLIAILATSLVAYGYFRRARGVGQTRALLLSLVIAFFPATAFLATSTVMAEPVFSFAQLAAIALVERTLRRQGGAALLASGAAGVLVAASILVRSIAAPLLPATGLYLAWRGRWREAIVACAVALALVAPWFLYARANAPTPEQQAVMNDQITVPYTAQFWLRLAGYQQYGWASPSELPRRLWLNVRTAATSSFGALHAYSLYRLIEPDEARSSLTAKAVSVGLTLVTIAGFAWTARRRVTLAELHVAAQMVIILAFPYPSYRYMVPLLPFFVLYASEGIELAVRLGTGRDVLAGRVSSAFLAACLLSHLMSDFAPLLETARTAGVRRSAWQRSFDENRALLAWVRENLPADALLATHNPAMVYLYSGRKTVGYWLPATDAPRWRAAGVGYWVDCWYAGEKYPDLSRRGRPILYRSPTLHHVVVDLRPESASGGSRAFSP
jgi:hypothetical protein